MCLGRRRKEEGGFLAEVTAKHPTLRMSRGLLCRCDRGKACTKSQGGKELRAFL